jgi:hypothetical protein
MSFGDDFELSGIALGSIVAIVAYHLARVLAPHQLREPLIEDRAYVGGAAISAGTVVTPEGEKPPFREKE